MTDVHIWRIGIDRSEGIHMTPEPEENIIRRSPLWESGRRVSALAFMCLILAGNIWVIYRFTGRPAPEWLYLGFVGMAVAALFGGVMILAGRIHERVVSGKSARISDLPKDEG